MTETTRTLLDTECVGFRRWRRSRAGNRLFLATTVLLGLAPAGCITDLEVPSDSLISCESDADCPGERVCSPTVMRCIDRGGDDQPPGIEGAVSITPLTVGIGGDVTISFASDKLDAIPIVALHWAGVTRDANLVNGSTDDTAWEYAYLTDAADPSGVADLTISLLDPSGNQVEFSLPRSVELDFVEPAVLDVSEATPNPANGGAIPVVTLVASEVLGEAPTLTIAGATAPFEQLHPLPSDPNQQSSTYLYIAGDAAAALWSDGDFSIAATLTDRAGNVATDQPITTVNIDSTAPGLLSSAITPPQVADGETFEVSFTVGEALAAAPVVRSGSTPLDSCTDGATPNSYLCVHTAQASEGDGIKPVTADLVDDAGNGVTVGLGDIEYDVTAPQVAGAVLLRTPAFLHADDPANDRVFFSRTDPFTGAAVTAILVVYADEELQTGIQPTVTAVNAAGDNLTFDPVEVLGKQARFECTLDPADAAGLYQFSVTWADLLTNSDTLAISTVLELDETAPDVAVIDPARLLYRRVPWGAEETGGASSFSLEIDAGPVGDTVAVAIYADAGGTINSQLAAIDLQPDGSASIPQLGGGDLPTLYYRLIDRAGVTTTTQQIGRVEWVATLGGKTAGDTDANPHLFYADPWHGGGMLSSLSFEPTDVGAMSNRGVDVSSQLGTPRWLRALGGDQPSAAGEPNMVYDSARDQILLRAGSSPGICGLNDTNRCDRLWTWEQNGWRELLPIDPGFDGNPPEGGSMAYDPLRDRTVLFQGNDEVWEWNGTSWTLLVPSDPEADLNPTTAGPLVFDQQRGMLLMVLTDGIVWHWNGVSWRRIDPTDVHGDGDPAYGIFGAAYDPDRDRIVLVPMNAPTVEVWEWDGAGWELLVPTSPDLPTPSRMLFALTFDPIRRRVLMQGGGASISCDGTPMVMPPMAPCEPVWLWDGVDWTRIDATDPENDGSPIRRAAGLVYHPSRGTFLLYGGGGFFPGCMGSSCSTTWEWNGTSWRRLYDTRQVLEPQPGRAEHGLVFDPSTAELLFFGGFGPNCTGGPSGYHCDDLWRFDGVQWHQQTPSGIEFPTPRYSHNFVTAAGGAYLSFGGCDTAPGSPTPPPCLDELWSFDGSQWALQIPTSTTNPAGRDEHAAAYDSARDRWVLFGGYGGDTSDCDGSGTDHCDGTWEWDGAAWERITPTSTTNPVGRQGHAMAYDPNQAVVLMFGGESDPFGLCDDTGTRYCDGLWQWDGAAWTQLTPTDPEGDGDPGPRTEHAMVYDTDQHRLITFGGWDGSIGFDSNETWTWDGVSWMLDAENRLGAALPTIRDNHAMIYDPVRGQAALVGGHSPTNDCDDLADEYCTTTWYRDASLAHTPAQLASFEVGAAGGPATGGCLSGSCPIQSVTVHWDVGASGYQDDLPAPGARLKLWRMGRWLELSGIEHGVADGGATDVASRLTWTTSDPTIIGGALIGDDQQLTVTATAIEPNGWGRARISSDYVELRVVYTP